MVTNAAIPRFLSLERPPKFPLPLAIVVGLVAAFWLTVAIYFYGGADIKSMDGQTYINAWDVILTGHTDILRTPVYPIIYGILTTCLGIRAGLYLLIILQWGFFIYALILFWQTAHYLRIPRAIASIAILLILAVPMLGNQNNMLMTESLSFSGIITLIWLSIKLLLTRSRRFLYLSATLTVLLILTRPALIFLGPLLALLWLYASWRIGPLMKASWLSISAIALILGAYLYCMHHTHLYTTFSVIPLHNRIYTYRAEFLINPEEINDAKMRPFMTNNLKKCPGGYQYGEQYYWGEMHGVPWHLLDSVANTVERNHPEEVRRAIRLRFERSLTANIIPRIDIYNYYINPGQDRMPYWTQHPKELYLEKNGVRLPIYNWLSVPIWVVLLIWATFTSVWIRRWILSRHFPAMQALLAAMFISEYFIVVYGAPNDFARLLTPVLPPLLLMAGWLVGAPFKPRTAPRGSLPLSPETDTPNPDAT